VLLENSDVDIGAATNPLLEILTIDTDKRREATPHTTKTDGCVCVCVCVLYGVCTGVCVMFACGALHFDRFDE
jgi:hypothetical protein